MKTKTSEATPLQLNWLVAKAEGLLCFGFIVDVAGTFAVIDSDRQCEMFEPSTNWHQAGPIIEREGIGLERDDQGVWFASYDLSANPSFGAASKEPLVAAMRCYVASKLGDIVEVPSELCKEEN